MNEQLSLKENLCLALDQKMVRPKKAAIDLKTNLAPQKILVRLSPMKAKGYVV